MQSQVLALWTLTLSVTTMLSLPAFAGDGRIEINQTCAVNTGCVAFDTPGFPVRITSADGSNFVLTSDLIVSNPNLGGILLLTEGITIDLNGFEIAGVVTCTGTGSALACDPGAGVGIEGTSQDRIFVRNGRIRGFGSGGLSTGEQSHIDRVAVFENGGYGIRVLRGSIVRNSSTHRNAGPAGIYAAFGPTIIESCTSNANLSHGIRVDFGSSVTGSTVRDNGGFGIYAASSASKVSNSSVTDNEAGGIRGGDRNSVVGNVVDENGDGPSEHGIDVGVGSTVAENTVLGSGDRGINAGAGSTVDKNTVFGSGGHGILVDVGSTVSGNTVRQSVADGINANSGSSVSGNTLRQNGGDGIEVFGATFVTKNTCDNNTAAGVHATGGENRIDGNTATNNGIGLDVDSSGNIIVRNTARANGSNYANVVSGNTLGEVLDTNAGGGLVDETTSPWANFSF